MTTLRKFVCDDLFTFNNINLDILTETYNMPFYLQYMAKWPEYYLLAEGPGLQSMGYSAPSPRTLQQHAYMALTLSPAHTQPPLRSLPIMGKAEGVGENWHGHVTAVTVAPDFRRLSLANKLMNMLEEITEKVHDGYFVDLFVRKSNSVAIGMYEKFGYTVYRQVLGYYNGDEDAYDMRKAMPRDVDKKSVVPLTRPIYPHELECD